MKKRNKFAVDLFTTKIEKEWSNQKKEKEVLKEKKIVNSIKPGSLI